MTAANSTESSLQETRRFAPPAAFAEQAHVGSIEEYEQLHARSIAEPEKFWAEVANELHWFRGWDQVLEWEAPDAEWFVGATTNLCYNCLDRQIDAGRGDQVAIVWEAEPPAPGSTTENFVPHVERLTYHDLLREVSKFANVLKAKGVQKGDVVTIYMGMVPQLAVAMLACARIGAVHSIIFGGFSAAAIRD
ncbi:MAG: acetyl-coenzyme A synthetase N-terminal domain-containing protein, partial [Planctomycetota bacterium]